MLCSTTWRAWAGRTTELFSREELEQVFSLDRLTKSPAVFDFKKLTWVNGQHIRRKSPTEIEALVRPVLAGDGLIADPPTPAQLTILGAAIPLIHERLSLINDASRLLRFALAEEVSYPRDELLPKGLDAMATRGLLSEAAARAEGFEERTVEENERIMRALADERGVKLGDLLMPLRVAVTGSRASPPLFGCMRLLGRDKVYRRVARALDLLKE